MTESATVTLLFTDLAGSTELLGRLGDDAAEELRRTHFGLLREAASIHGGQEVKTLGDGLMVAFPSTLAGVSCAVAMQQRVARHNAEHADRQLGLRVGVNVGEAISEEDDYFGTPVVVAKRLCDRAQPGQILISQVVRALLGTRGGYRFSDLGSLALKGLADPVSATELAWQPGEGGGRAAETIRGELGVRESLTDFQSNGLPLPATLAREAAGQFVGRAGERERMGELMGRARAGRHLLALIAGEPGVGKTRLASEFARGVHAEGVLVLYGRCEEEALVPFQPFVEALDQYVAIAGIERLRAQLRAGGGELTRLLPALRRRLPDLPAPGGGDPATERYRLFEAVVGLLYQLAQETPVLLVLDDLHWADKPTLLLLRHVMRAPQQGALLIIGTYRDVELTHAHALTDTLADLRRDRLFERLALGGLSEPEVAALIGAWARQVPSTDLVKAIWRDTEGHPFFVQELLRHLLESGAIYERGGRLRSNIERIGIPEGVREVIESRLARLDQVTRRVLSVGAVIGREFGVDVLERVSEVSGERLFELLEQAAAARVIGEATGLGSYAFSHALIRDTLYRDLTTPHRVRLHQRIGQALEALHDGDRDVYLGELAYHYFEAAAGADALTKAIEYADQAGRRATEQLGYEDAAAHYERAVRGLALKTGEEPRRCGLMLARAESLFSAGEFTLARETFRQAGELADQLGLPDELARAALGFGGGLSFDVGVIDPVLISLLERALMLLGDQDSTLCAGVLARLAEALAISPQRDRAVGLRGQAVRMAERVGDKGVLAEVLAQSMWAHAGPDNVDEQLAIADQIVGLAREAGDTRPMADGYAWQFAAAFQRGDIQTVDAALEAYARLAEESRQPYQLWQAALFAANRAFLDKPVSEIERLVWRALEVGQATQNPSAVQVFGAQILYVRPFQGRAAELRAGFEGFADYSPQLPAFRCALAWIYCQMGRDGDARRELERLATNDFGDLPRDVFWLTCMELLSELCCYLDDERRAAILYEQLVPYADHWIVVGEFGAPRGCAHRQLGLLAATMSRFDQAAEHFHAALEPDTTTGSPHALAKARCDYAAMLLRRDHTGDRAEAIKLLEAAQAAAERLEITSVIEGATALRRRAAGKPAVQLATRGSTRLGERASLIVSEAKAALSTRGRTAITKLFGDTSDEDLERRFGSPFAQRAVFTAIARSFQPRLAFGFEGEIAYELTHCGGANESRPPDWWTIRVDGARAVARHRTAHSPAVTVHVSVPAFVRVFSGEDDPVAAMLEGRLTIDGDLVLGARLTEMFGAISPSEVLVQPR